MKKNKFRKLESNLCRTQISNSLFNQKLKLMNLSHGRYKKWLSENLLPDTRLIIEPKIAGYSAVINYEKGTLVNLIINKQIFTGGSIKFIKSIPSSLPIRKNIQIRGELYLPSIKKLISNKIRNDLPIKTIFLKEEMAICCFHIFNSNQNQYQVLQELKKLGFEIPDSHFTKYTNEVDLYVGLWKKGKVFQKYPTDGLVIKVNSRKLQKQLGETNLWPNWSFKVKA